MRDVDEEIDDLRATATMLLTAVAELITWAGEVEQAGVAPGSMTRARKLVELGKLQRDVETMQDALTLTANQTLPTIRARLAGRISDLQRQVDTLKGELHGA